MTNARRRLWMISLILMGAAVATGLVLGALRQNIAYFRTPSELVGQTYPEKKNHRPFRLGGIVEVGSVRHHGTALDFRVTDSHHEIPVHYDGIAPDLFREGQGVIVAGILDESGTVQANLLLAKHDEYYRPQAFQP